MSPELLENDYDEGKRLSPRDVLNWLLFARHAVRRRRWLAACVFVIGTLVTIGGVALRSKQYRVEVRVLARSADVLANLVNPRRPTTSRDQRDLLAGAEEQIKSRQSRTQVIEATKLDRVVLVENGFVAKLKAQIREALFDRPDAKLLHKALLKALDDNIQVSVYDQRVLVIRVTWNDPHVTRALAQAVLDQFLAGKRERELAELKDTVTILERTLIRSRAQLEEKSRRLENLIVEKEADLKRRLGSASVRDTSRVISFQRPVAAPQEQERAPPSEALRQKRQELDRARGQWQRRLDRANSTLARLKDSLGPRHPDVQSATREAMQAAVIPAELEALEAEYRKLAAQEEAEAAPEPFTVVKMPLSEAAYAAISTDPDVEALMTELHEIVAEFNELTDRRSDAELEIEMTSTGFTHRFLVTEPPAVPLHPTRSLSGPLRFVGIVLSFILAVLACMVADLMAGRIFETFQIERSLGLEIIGEYQSDK
jgi:uncharacterized protein involved in exopolysaccharide biosynthesis